VAVRLHTESGRKQVDDGVGASPIDEKSGRKVSDEEKWMRTGEEKLTSPGEIVEHEYADDKRSHENDKLPVVIETHWGRRESRLELRDPGTYRNSRPMGNGYTGISVGPTQREIDTYWSERATHLPHMRQCLERRGFLAWKENYERCVE